MRSYSLIVVSTLTLAIGCAAPKKPTPNPSGPPSATPQSSPQLNLEVETYTLKNGLTVLLSHDDRLPVVAVEVRYLVGSANERPGRSGFAHLFEHLMFQGSANYNDEFFKPP